MLAGLVTYFDGAQCFGCTIRDLSETGARITLPQRRIIPANVYLINFRAGVAYEATVAWRAERDGGLSFLRTISLAELSDSKLGYLKKLWSSRAIR